MTLLSASLTSNSANAPAAATKDVVAISSVMSRPDCIGERFTFDGSGVLSEAGQARSGLVFDSTARRVQQTEDGPDPSCLYRGVENELSECIRPLTEVLTLLGLSPLASALINSMTAICMSSSIESIDSDEFNRYSTALACETLHRATKAFRLQVMSDSCTRV